MALQNKKYEKSDKDELILEQWSKAVEMADTSIDKRINSSNVYLTIEVALIAVISFVGHWWNYVVAAIGIIVSIVWYMSLKSYRVLSQIKYEVINEIEENLPVQPFKYEWELLKANKGYRQVTCFEKCLPIIFGALCCAFIIGLIITGNTSTTN